MRLVLAILGFVLRKAGLLVALVLSMFLAYLLVQAVVPPLREAVTDRDRLPQVTQERAALENDLEELRSRAAKERLTALASLGSKLAAEVDAGRRNIADKKAEIERLRADELEACGPVRKVIAWILPGNACKAAELAVEKANAALDTLEESLRQAEEAAAILGDPELSAAEKLERLGEGGKQSVVEREISNKEAELSQKRAEEASLEQSQASGVGWALNQWFRSWRWLAAIGLLVLISPLVVRFVSYFLLMPLVNRLHKPIHLAAGSDTPEATIRHTEAQRTLTTQLGPGEVLFARSEHVRPAQGGYRSQLLYNRKAPFISFAAGLYGLAQITGDEHITTAVLSTPDDPDSYLMRIDFTDHPGLVMRPRHVVGVIGQPELKTRWRWGIQSLANWQVRYIMFVGTGSLIIQGSGDIVTTTPQGRPTRMEQNLVMGFDSRLAVGVNRTEIFIPYLWGRTPLVDTEFTGPYPFFWQKSSVEDSRNPIARTFDAIFSAIGKLLGF